jgi:ribosome-interacting GTPase 1
VRYELASRRGLLTAHRGKSAKYDQMKVGLKHMLADQDVVSLVTH